MNSAPIGKVRPIHLEHIDRESVRRFVNEYNEVLLTASYGGENIHQLALDQQDQVKLFAATLSEEKAELFWTLYAEELNAATNAANDRTNAINTQAVQTHIEAAQNASNVATWISIITFFAFLFWMIKLMKS